ncbi:hypothetical protein MRS44_014475 [Fusarium solani]|uniref:Uncharacterized protein n=1 Tax=Fusarium solani TaxID=169388 RepID=A0A9P9GTZ0_FUSSL|nr:uncharacterized protein B0J15DRAFT_86698 [Fusarium solani]KAH7244712.1 hypothetical protein B0J15DRAFT_86698 [Fusarium solani]KAJ3457334.1 hypothetical protein MRS44_014475 [Fusarium solani]KAJ4228932.1 hypothetical protein NW759_003652 [Fusarium solani]
MPVTSRGVVQLTPDTTLATSTRNYLNNLPPSLATLQTGLALFAVVVIARFCVVRLYLWLRQVRGAERHTSILPTSRSHILSAPHPQLLPSRPIWTMDEKDITPPATQEDLVPGEGLGEDKSAKGKKLVINPNWQNGALPMQVMSRPPPAPPLTPPELSTAVFTFDDRPRPGEDSFIHQPNPDYMSSTTSAILPPRSASPSIARRRSYNKTLPIGVPVPASQGTSDAADLTFSPSSYPPTSPLLPPAPPNAGAKGIDVQGEIIGVLDAEGAGWTRHTRVYGGGVCLACAASGGNHGGGFYGATVRPEEMR